jgi:general secretion pathway protein B
MSYILDALRRADAERERGAVPGIHARPLQAAASTADAQPAARPWVWAVLGLLLAVIGVVLWQTLFGGAASQRPETALSSAQTPDAAPLEPPRSRAVIASDPTPSQTAPPLAAATAMPAAVLAPTPTPLSAPVAPPVRKRALAMAQSQASATAK